MTDKPHDALFRGTFSQLEHAASELRSVLPAELSAQIEWASLSLEPGRFVSERLEGRVTDLLYSARLRGGRPLRLLVLFEHQSTEQPRMALRLLDYMVAIWKRLDAERGAAEALPPIIPVVLHNGERPWTAPRSLRALFLLGEQDWRTLAPFVPDLCYLLDDLAVESAERIRARPVTARARLVLWCLARARDPAFVDEVSLFRDAFLEVLAADESGGAFMALMRYVQLVSDAEPARLEAALRDGVGPRAQEAFVSMADKLLEKGRKEGIERGIEKGQREMLVKLLQVKFGELTWAQRARLDAASPTELDRWTERVLDASSLDDLFEG